MPSPETASRRGAVLRGAGFAIAVALGAIALWLIVTGKTQKRLEIGILAGLWGFLLAAYTMFGSRRPMHGEAASDVSAVPLMTSANIALRGPGDVETLAEAAARRAFEQRLEALLRREIKASMTREIEDLRGEITALRQELLDKVGGQLRLERIETTRVIGSDLEALQHEVRQLKVASEAPPAVVAAAGAVLEAEPVDVAADERAEQERAERERADRGRADRERGERERAERERAERGRAERQRAERQRSERQRAEAAARAAQQRAAEQRAAVQRAAEQRAAEERAAERRAAQQRAAAQQAAEQRAAEERAAEEQAAEQRVAEQRVAEQRVAEQRAAEQQAAEQRAADERAAERVAEQRRAGEAVRAAGGQDPFASLPRLTPFTDFELDPADSAPDANEYTGRRRARGDDNIPVGGGPADSGRHERADARAEDDQAGTAPSSGGHRHRHSDDDGSGSDLLASLLAREGARR